jgi:SEC-C motif
MTRLGKQPARYRFILNPYAQERFDFCPQCDGPTEERKFPLFIHVDPMCPFCLNKTCRYCPRCELLIAHRDEVEQQLALILQEHQPDSIGNDYLVMGTLDVEVWERGRQTPLTIQEMKDNLHDFEAVLSIQPAGPSRPPRQRQRPGMPSPGRTASGRAPGRNAPCWCGSGKKYKSCHLRQDAP